MDKRVKLRVQGLTNSKIQSGAYALILAEENSNRRLPVVIGTAEAQSIAIQLEGIIPPRPLTHDLFTTFAQAFDISLKEVYIYKFVDGVYYSEMRFSDGDKIVDIDSRTSDAIAIAIRVGCEIYTNSSILDECAITLYEQNTACNSYQEEDDDVDLLSLEPEEIDDEETLKKWLSLIPNEELQARLEHSISRENYEYAKMYKDELSRRDKKEESDK